jgi:HSP20 family molecular chaperone IbpA
MTTRRPGTGFFWTDALDLLAEADRLHRQFFTSTPSPGLVPNWQPPVDTLETADAVIVLVALPGVAPQNVEIVHHDGALTVRGMRPMPGDGARETIRRLEIPYGQFERRLDLPVGRYDLVERVFVDGNLRLTLRKLD